MKIDNMRKTYRFVLLSCISLLLILLLAVSAVAFEHEYKDEITADILYAFENNQNKIYLNDYGLSYGDLVDVWYYMQEVKEENPIYFNVANSGTRGEDSGGLYITYKNKYSVPVYLELRERVEAEIDSILKDLPNESSDFATALAAHDYICSHYEYSVDDTTSSKYHSIEGILLEGKGVCEAYAKLYLLLLSKFGIESDIVSSEPMKHAWNVVEIDGEWYHVDATWDDPTTNGADVFGRSYHFFFLVSDDTMRDSEHEHYGWDSDVECTSKKYENAPWYRTKGPVAVGDGSVYYIDTYNKNLYEVDVLDYVSSPKDIEPKLLYSIDTKWRVGDGYYSDAFSGICYIDGWLYFNDAKSIMVMKCDGTDRAVFASPAIGNKNIYYCRVKNGVLTYSYSSDPYDVKQYGTLRIQFLMIDKSVTEFFARTDLNLSFSVNTGADPENILWVSIDPGVVQIVNGKPKIIGVGCATLRAFFADNADVYDEITIDVRFLRGDYYPDGVVDTKDSVLLAQYLARWDGVDKSSLAMEAADVNKDGAVDIKDAVLLAQYLAKWNVTIE